MDKKSKRALEIVTVGGIIVCIVVFFVWRAVEKAECEQQVRLNVIKDAIRHAKYAPEKNTPTAIEAAIIAEEQRAFLFCWTPWDYRDNLQKLKEERNLRLEMDSFKRWQESEMSLFESKQELEMAQAKGRGDSFEKLKAIQDRQCKERDEMFDHQLKDYGNQFSLVYGTRKQP